MRAEVIYGKILSTIIKYGHKSTGDCEGSPLAVRNCPNPGNTYKL